MFDLDLRAARSSGFNMVLYETPVEGVVFTRMLMGLGL